jgi:hypothetical protein
MVWYEPPEERPADVPWYKKPFTVTAAVEESGFL